MPIIQCQGLGFIVVAVDMMAVMVIIHQKKTRQGNK